MGNLPNTKVKEHGDKIANPTDGEGHGKTGSTVWRVTAHG
jgi:hypothetical protein